MADQAQNQLHGMLQKLHEHRPSSRQVLGLITLLAAGGIALFLGGLLLIGTVIALIVLTPVFILFSPILVPLGIVLFLGAVALFTAVTCCVAMVSAGSWIYKYMKGGHPPGADQIDYARMRIADTAQQMKHRAREYGGMLQNKLQEAAPGA